MRVLPRSPYVLAILGAAAVVAVAWGARGQYQMVGPGTDAPEFTATSLSGDTMRLADFRGRVVLLNIWATWCAPCREEMPSMERLYRRLQERGVPFEVVAVSIDARTGDKDVAGNVGGDLAAFVEAFELTFTVLHDPSGRIQRTYQTTGVPESFLIAREGTVYRRLVGAVEWDTPEWEEAITRLAGTAP
jgi:peroxiredoxin